MSKQKPPTASEITNEINRKDKEAKEKLNQLLKQIIADNFDEIKKSLEGSKLRKAITDE